MLSATRQFASRFQRPRVLRAARRAGGLLVLALVNLSVLTTAAPFSMVIAEPEAEIVETLQIDWFSPPEGPRSLARTLHVRRLPASAMRQPRDASHAAGTPGSSFLPRAAGHRLANGLLAPMQC